MLVKFKKIGVNGIASELLFKNFFVHIIMLEIKYLSII